MKPSIRSFLSRHLYFYLVVLVGISVSLSILLARGQLLEAFRSFDLLLLFPILLLSFFNYVFRFFKWHRLLALSGAPIPWRSNAKIFFACFTMVVTPARLGELYRLVFVRRLHGVSAQKTIPALFVERLTDAIAILALSLIGLTSGILSLVTFSLVLAAALVLGAAVGHPGWNQRIVNIFTRIPGLKSRKEALSRVLRNSSILLAPRSLGPALIWSVLAWFCECLGLHFIARGLGASIGVFDATWIYATSTLFGNLTFLPGGLGSTEASLLGLLKLVDIQPHEGLAITILVRVATLWFAVFLGLAVTLLARRSLQWKEVGEEAALFDPEDPNPRADHS